jgi:hypothetical protein
MKEWLQWLPPPRSVLALLLAVVGFSGRLFASHFTHSPTLLVDTCHSLCRLITTVLAYKVINIYQIGQLRTLFIFTIALCQNFNTKADISKAVALETYMVTSL